MRERTAPTRTPSSVAESCIGESPGMQIRESLVPTSLTSVPHRPPLLALSKDRNRELSAGHDGVQPAIRRCPRRHAVVHRRRPALPGPGCPCADVECPYDMALADGTLDNTGSALRTSSALTWSDEPPAVA